MGERLAERLQKQQTKNQAGCKRLSRSCIGRRYSGRLLAVFQFKKPRLADGALVQN